MRGAVCVVLCRGALLSLRPDGGLCEPRHIIVSSVSRFVVLLFYWFSSGCWWLPSLALYPGVTQQTQRSGQRLELPAVANGGGATAADEVEDEARAEEAGGGVAAAAAAADEGEDGEPTPLPIGELEEEETSEAEEEGVSTAPADAPADAVVPAPATAAPAEAAAETSEAEEVAELMARPLSVTELSAKPQVFLLLFCGCVLLYYVFFTPTPHVAQPFYAGIQATSPRKHNAVQREPGQGLQRR